MIGITDPVQRSEERTFTFAAGSRVQHIEAVCRNCHGHRDALDASCKRDGDILPTCKVLKMLSEVSSENSPSHL